MAVFWPTLRLPSFALNRALGDIGILSSISKRKMCPIILYYLCVSLPVESSHARPQRRMAPRRWVSGTL
jgi:hypothetical protein